jgi:DnaJ family protein C protein 28
MESPVPSTDEAVLMSDIDDQIRKALEEGKFDDLPGKGKPLNLDDNPYADPNWQLAHHMLRSSGYTLPWIAARQEIDAQIETARATLARAWEWREGSLKGGQPNDQVDPEWQRVLKAFQEQVDKINKKIFDYNLQTPSEKFQLMKLNAGKEIETIKSGDLKSFG